MALRTCTVERELKRDLLGRVELVRCGDELLVRRRRTRVLGVGLVAGVLARREQKALRALAGLDGVPTAPMAVAGRNTFRSWIPGQPLCCVAELRTDFFARLEALVRELHRRGVCHNDLHKEANILVREDGTPALIDFQLASVHRVRGKEFRKRAEEDIRHVHKHHARYLDDGAASASVVVPPRRLVSQLWRLLWKPVYNRIARSRLFRHVSSGEPERRPRGQRVRWVEPASAEREDRT